LDAILTSPGLRCTADENFMQNSIRITGIQSDVKTMIFLLREAQNPPSVDSMTTMAESTTSTAAVLSTAAPSSVTPTNYTDSFGYVLYLLCNTGN